MIEQITLGEIGLVVTFIVGLMGGITYLKKNLKDWIVSALKEQLDNIHSDIKDVKDHIDDVDLNSCKNFLVARLSEAEQEMEWDEVVRERFWEQYEHYTKDLDGNSYIEQKVEKLKSERKI